MMKTMLLSLFGVLVLVLVNGLPLNQCPRSLSGRGTLFFPYAEDCEKFIRCKTDGDLNATVMECPFATYWNQESLTCDSADQVDCPVDKCFGKSNGIDRDDVKNCRGYWECTNGKSVPKCCAFGEKFDGALKECVLLEEDEEPCNATCFGEIFDGYNETSNETLVDMNPIITECNFEKVPDSPFHYYEIVAGYPVPFKRRCGAGTQYVEELCACDYATQTTTCKPDFLLTFNSNEIHDESEHNYYAYVQGVEVENGSGVFTGDSKIVIPRYNNIQGLSTMIINITYKSNETELVDVSQGIVSNDNCYDPTVDYNTEPSVLITEDNQGVYFSVGTTEMDVLMNTTSVSHLPSESTSGVKNVVYSFRNGQLTGALKNGDTSNVLATGAMRSVQCDLVIGAAKGMENFRGTIDEISIYTCVPENFELQNSENIPSPR